MKYNQTNLNTISFYCMNEPGAYEASPFGNNPICYKVMGKIFAQLNAEQNFYRLTLKCEPEQGIIYRDLYPGVVTRGYHCPPVQQPYWNTINLDEFNSMDEVLNMIDEAYDAVIRKFSRKSKAQYEKITEMDFILTNGEDNDFKKLCVMLDDTLNNTVGSAIQHEKYDKYNKTDDITEVIVAYYQGSPAGCGAFKLFDEEHAELKRIYVAPEYRGMGLGSEIVRRLEARAKIIGFKWCILETGKSLQAARHMYSKAGYKIIDNFGQYQGMTGSVCMSRKI